MSVTPSLSSQQLASLSELRSCYTVLCEYLATFPGEVTTDDASLEQERIKQRFSKFRDRHIRDYTADVANEVQRRLQIFEAPTKGGADDDDDDEYLVLSRTRPARLELAKLPDHAFRSAVADIHIELTRRYFGENSPFELNLRRQLNAKTAELYFAAGKEACEAFEKIFADEVKYRQLLAYRGDQAQTLLDLMSMLVDHPSLEPQSKSCMIKTIMRLSQNSFLYPKSLLVDGIKRDDIPFSSGTFGDVYRGTFRGQVVGLKVIKLYKKSDIGKIFKVFSREAMLWAHLSHPNILPFYGIYRMGDMYGRLALISPWMAQGNLREYLENEPDVDRILLLIDIVNGLQYLHENGIVHGDMKGDNILVTSNGRACLADFGLSNVVQTRLGGWNITTLMHHGGTIRWEAPELMQETNVTPTMASDIYALAMIFYEVFTGRVPFYEAKVPTAVIYRVVSGQGPTRPARDSDAYRVFGLSEEIWEMMQRGWNADPEARPRLPDFLGVLSGCGRVDRRRKDEYWEALPPSKFRDAMNGVYRRLTIEEIAHVVSWFG